MSWWGISSKKGISKKVFFWKRYFLLRENHSNSDYNSLFRFLFLFYHMNINSKVKFFCKLLCVNKLEKRFRMICLLDIIHGYWYFNLLVYYAVIEYIMVVSLCCRMYMMYFVDKIFTLDIEHFSLTTEIKQSYHVVMSSIQTIGKELLHSWWFIKSTKFWKHPACHVIKSLDVSFCINRKIAEFATGGIWYHAMKMWTLFISAFGFIIWFLCMKLCKI